MGWMFCLRLFSLSLSVILEMLSKPSIFHDSRSEVIKGQTIEVRCQSINGTAPVFYQLSDASKPVANQSVGSNEPAIFRDKPMKDVEYWCSADNCHSHTKMFSEVLRVKVIGKSLCYEKNPWGTAVLVHIFKGLRVDKRSGWYLCKVHKHGTCQSKTKAQVTGAGKYLVVHQCGWYHLFSETFK